MKDRTLLMIPGPVEFEPVVLQAMGAPTISHVAPDFISAFGQALKQSQTITIPCKYLSKNIPMLFFPSFNNQAKNKRTKECK